MTARSSFSAKGLTAIRALVVALAGLALPAPILATTLEMRGFGPRAVALANTSEALADDYFAVYANPANLALAKDIHFGFGTDALLNRFAIDRVAGEDVYPSRLPRDSFLGHLGVSTPLPGWLQDRAALGVAIHLPFSGPTRLDALDHRSPQLPMYDTLGDRLALVFGVAARPWPWLAVGVSGQLLTTLQGSAQVDLSILDHRVTYKALDVELLTEVFPIVGVTLLPREDVRIALTWRGKSEVRYRLPLDVDMEGVGRLHFQIAGIGLFLPDTFALAGSMCRGNWTWTAGAAWARWSQLPPLAPDVQLVLDDRAVVPPGSKPDEILYVVNTPLEVGARDILQPRLGLEHAIRPGLVWRAGLQYRPTPLPKADGAAAYLDSPATTAGLGASVVLDDPLGVAKRPLTIDVAAAWTVLARRSVSKRDPQDPVQATSLHGDSWHLSLALHHDF